MGSSIDSSRPTVFWGSKRQRRMYGPNLYGLDVFGNAFVEPGGCLRKDIEDLWPALPYKHGDLPDTIAVLEHPGPPALQASPVPIDDVIDSLYAPHFRRLELGLEANIARPPVHVPPFVSAGRVAQMSLEVDAAGVTEPSLLSVLEEHVPAKHAK